jgi:hypothetical protein
MAIMSDTSVGLELYNTEQFSSKEEIRAFLMTQWIAESSETKYRYFVDTYDNGLSIYLERPGRLNKGCDFVIYAENAYVWGNGNDRPPDHNFVLNDMMQKKTVLTSDQWSMFISAIELIYNAQPYDTTIQYTSSLPSIGRSYELTIKLIKWFFIEQDITYWFGEGRRMLYKAIMNV